MNKKETEKQVETESKEIIQGYLESPDLPDAVKRQLQKAAETPKEPVVGIEAEPIVEPVIVETVEPDKPADVENVNNPYSEIVSEVVEDYKQKYLTLQGKYDKEVPHLSKIAKSKDDVIDFYKTENRQLKSELDSAKSQVVPESINLSDIARKKLQDAGFDDDDLELAQSVLLEVTEPLQRELAKVNSKEVNHGVRAFDSLLITDGFIDSVSMRSQPQYDFSMDHYGDYSLTANQLLDIAIKNNDNKAAARILVDVQMAMVQDGRWVGTHPKENSAQPIEPVVATAQHVAPVPKPVLPHSVVSTAPVKEKPMDINELEKASREFQKGNLSHEKYVIIKDKIMSQMTNNTT